MNFRFVSLIAEIAHTFNRTSIAVMCFAGRIILETEGGMNRSGKTRYQAPEAFVGMDDE